MHDADAASLFDFFTSEEHEPKLRQITAAPLGTWVRLDEVPGVYGLWVETPELDSDFALLVLENVESGTRVTAVYNVRRLWAPEVWPRGTVH